MSVFQLLGDPDLEEEYKTRFMREILGKRHLSLPERGSLFPAGSPATPEAGGDSAELTIGIRENEPRSLSCSSSDQVRVAPSGFLIGWKINYGVQ